MAKEYMCVYDGTFGKGKTLKEAFEDVNDEHGNDLQVSDCEFYEVEEIAVEFAITKKEVVSKITKKQCGD